MLLGEHSVVYDQPCLVTAVDLRLLVQVQANDRPDFVLTAPDLGVFAYQRPLGELTQGNLPKAVSFVETAYYLLLERFPQAQGLRVHSYNQFQSAYGLGSSSASVVAFLAAAADFYDLKLDQWALFDLAYRTVLQVQGVASGFDLASAIWGGTLYYQKPAAVGQRPVVEPLSLAQDNLPLLVGYSGIKADTATLIGQVATLHSQQTTLVADIFDMITNLVHQAKSALVQADWIALGHLLDVNHRLLQQLGVSSPELERLVLASRQAGALGAKLSGAGGGDCMLAVATEQQQAQVVEAITAAGGKIIPVQLHAAGVRLESSRPLL